MARGPTPADMASVSGANRGNEVDDDRVDRVDDFMLDIREVTLGEFRSCVESGACSPRTTPAKDGEWIHNRRGCRRLDLQRARLPVNCVTFRQAEQFCAWRGARLPSVDEWLFEARGGDASRPWPWGSEPLTCQRANVRGCGSRVRRARLRTSGHPDGASRHGAADMLGNVAEIVTLDASAYTVIGGSFKDYYTSRVPGRDVYVPVEVATNGRTPLGSHVGFRCARSTANANE